MRTGPTLRDMPVCVGVFRLSVYQEHSLSQDLSGQESGGGTLFTEGAGLMSNLEKLILNHS